MEYIHTLYKGLMTTLTIWKQRGFGPSLSLRLQKSWPFPLSCFEVHFDPSERWIQTHWSSKAAPKNAQNAFSCGPAGHQSLGGNSSWQWSDGLIFELEMIFPICISNWKALFSLAATFWKNMVWSTFLPIHWNFLAMHPRGVWQQKLHQLCIRVTNHHWSSLEPAMKSVLTKVQPCCR